MQKNDVNLDLDFDIHTSQTYRPQWPRHILWRQADVPPLTSVNIVVWTAGWTAKTIKTVNMLEQVPL